MRFRHLFTSSAALAAAMLIAGCGSESSTSPQPPQAPMAPPAAAHSTLLGTPATAIPLLRTTPLASDITVSKTIGILGGTLAIPAAGVSVVVPPLAVTKNTTFTMTARAGYAVAYDFAPHGTKFTLPLVMTQNLTNTQGTGSLLSALQLGYYADGTQPTLVSELLSVNVDLLHLVGVSSIWHFSGYIFMSGRSDADQ